MLTQFRNFQSALQWRLFMTSNSFCVSAIQQRSYSCSAVDCYLQFFPPRETNLSLSMAWRVIKAIGLSFNPSNLMDLPVHGFPTAFFRDNSPSSPLSLRKELLGLVLGTSLNHRPELRAVNASFPHFHPSVLGFFQLWKSPRFLMCYMEVNKHFPFRKVEHDTGRLCMKWKKGFFLSLSRCMLSALCFSSRRHPSFCMYDGNTGKAPVPLSFTDALARRIEAKASLCVAV